MNEWLRQNADLGITAHSDWVLISPCVFNWNLRDELVVLLVLVVDDDEGDDVAAIELVLVVVVLLAIDIKSARVNRFITELD